MLHTECVFLSGPHMFHGSCVKSIASGLLSFAGLVMSENIFMC
jgi:hypothetical protein